MASQIRTRDRAEERWQTEGRRRLLAHREFQRGKQDGRLGFCVSGLSPEYIEGYTLGRKIFYGLVRG